MVGSLTTFLGSSAVILILIAADKFGLTVNETMVKWFAFAIVTGSFLYLLKLFLLFL